MILRDSLRNLLLITKDLGENVELLRDNLLDFKDEVRNENATFLPN